MLDERSLTKGEDSKKEKYVKGMKKSFSDFRARYGDDAKSVMYATATNMAKEENIQELGPVVAGAAAVTKMAAKQAVKQAVKKGATKAAGMAAGRSVATAGTVKTGSVAGTSKYAGKSAAQQSSAIVKSKPGMKSQKAPSVPKKAEGGTVDKTGMTSTRSGSSSYTPGTDKKKPEEKDKKKETDKSGVSGDTVKKKVRSAAGQLQGIFEPKESYEQDGELLTFSDFREIVTICGADEEELDEFNIIQKAMDVVDKVNRTNQKKVDMINKIRPGSASMPKHGYFTPKKEEVANEGASWTKKSGKNSEGGLNEKGRKSYEKENPGSDLKAPSKKVGNPRRASFCARMKGMKKKLTSKKTASDPDSRINKSLRAWNC